MSAPACVRRMLRFSLKDLHAGDGVLASVRLDHLREEDGALVCAEGEEEAAALPAGTADIWSTDSRIFAYRPADNAVTVLPAGLVYPATQQLVRIVNHVDADGDDTVCALCEDAMYVYSNITVSAVKYEPAPSCTGLAAHHERLFGASGRRIRYTDKGSFRTWTPYTETGAGYCDMLPAGGRTVDVVALRDKVFFLREYGITRLTGYADVYNFRLADLPFPMGKIVSRAAVIGEEAFFFTAKGLCAFDGSAVRRAEGADDADIDLASPIRADRHTAGELVASVTLKDGETALYVYDPALRRGRFVRHAFEKFAAADDVLLMRGGKAYRLTGRALPAGEACALTLCLSLTGLGEGEKRLEAVLVEGGGAVTVTACGADGVARSVQTRAGGRADFAAGVRGETVTLRISSQDEGICIRALTLCVRREERI